MWMIDFDEVFVKYFFLYLLRSACCLHAPAINMIMMTDSEALHHHSDPRFWQSRPANTTSLGRSISRFTSLLHPSNPNQQSRVSPLATPGHVYPICLLQLCHMRLLCCHRVWADALQRFPIALCQRVWHA